MLLHHSVVGDGPPLILIHGLFGMGDNLAMIARPLSTKFRVYSVDLRNHGRSFRAVSMTFAEMANDIADVMDEYDLDKVSVLGHSLGGKVAMQLALDWPERVEKLIVADIAPVTYNGGGHDEVFAGLRAIDPISISSRIDAEKVLKSYISDSGVRQFILKSFYRKKNGKFDWRLNIDALQSCYDVMRQGNKANNTYSGSCLFVKGENSAYIQEKHRESILQLFPHAAVRVIKNTGHWLHAEKPAVFVSIVERFLIK